jgi:hypothetical protein
MTNKTRKVLSLFTNTRTHFELFNMFFRGYLFDTGWVNSFIKQRPVDKDNSPVPWLTMPFNAFIGQRLSSDMTIFEYGSGNSTLFYAKKVKEVVAVENDKGWLDTIKNQMPANVTLIFEELKNNDDRYSKAAMITGKHFDMIVVDGRERVKCMINAVECLSDRGVMVLDNSDRESYIPGIEFILSKGFKKIDFWGIAPSFAHQTCTTVFYRPSNCLDI